MKNPYPSCPHRLPRHVLFCDREDGRRLTVTWAETFAAKHWLDELVAGCKIVRLDKHTIALDDGDVEVRCEELEEVMKYELRGDERSWELPTPEIEQIARLFGKRRQLRHIAPIVLTPKRASVSVYVTISELAKSVNLTAREARARLRQAKVPKPVHGRWEWDADEAKRIAQVIR